MLSVRRESQHEEVSIVNSTSCPNLGAADLRQQFLNANVNSCRGVFSNYSG